MRSLVRVLPGLALTLMMVGTAISARAQDEPTPEDSTRAMVQQPSFARDVAPILVNVCQRCHNPRSTTYRTHGFDMTTFESFLKGGNAGSPVTPRNAAESLMVHHIKGENGFAKMPPGGQNNLGPQAIERIERWINAGALLDEGRSPREEIQKFAASAESLEREALGKLSAEERDKVFLTRALELYRKSGLKDAPQTAVSTHFVAVGPLPQARLQHLTKEMEKVLVELTRFLGRPVGAPLIEAQDKVVVLVFTEKTPFSEFVQSDQNRRLERTSASVHKFTAASSYVAVVDPLKGSDEPDSDRDALAAKKKRGSTRNRAADSPAGPERTLVGLATQDLVEGLVGKVGKSPRFLAMGLGCSFAQRVEPASPYYNTLRRDAFNQLRIGWATKANETLGDQGDPQDLRAMGFSLVEWLSTAPPTRPRFPLFAQVLIADGGNKLDEALERIYYTKSREQFIGMWGQWVGTAYRGLVGGR
ncbi:hypothetical protein Isop_1047 [Isosphaera pallida ATCC 43644]|uniref:Cytochrome C Planctomycete-type domain-containing protein n=1 Tax=Isosphaera pallida (strain ATCC 43644 / DSM 9630 / IS1B) TaxID=575540 RepID=E8R448_ISOPI|nr:c-type cytochrome domain-containing protein [Isosphaera pallida]ADV61635.1 hypothetical protein Isop_1047 [Isosphaera pallida ATCC 43644]